MFTDAIRLARRVVTWPFRYGRLPNRHDLRRWRLWLNSHLQHRAPNLVLARALWKIDPYELWLQRNTWNERAAAAARDILAALETRPAFSIVIPVYNPPLRWLARAIDTVRAQVYPHWQICIADDASTDPAVKPFLLNLARDPRIRVAFCDVNGHISRASNAAAGLATGDYLVLLDQDDELTPDCLLELACAAQRQPPDVIYSDEDKIDVEGRRRDPHFKPGWSPELLLSINYLCHVSAIRREAFEAVGGFRPGFEGAQDHDLALRVTERAGRVVHVPRVLYHWRTLPSSTAHNGGAKTYAFEAGVRSVQEALDRRGRAGRAFWPEKCRQWLLGGYQIEFPDDGPSVTILIPTKNRIDMLRRCIESLQKTSYRNYQVLIIDNESDDPEAVRYLEEIRSRHRVIRIGNSDGQFNYARIHNQVVPYVDSEHLLLLNNDTEVVHPEWLSQMVGYAAFPGVGAVGARLLYPDRSTQHVGVVMGLGGMVGHVRKNRKPIDPVGYRDQVLAANYRMVTAACMLVKRSLFLEVGGMDDVRFGIAYNDVDFCMKLHERGLRCVYAPRAELIHHESVSRGATVRPSELQALRLKWSVTDPDPYYNPNLAPYCDSQLQGTRRQLPSRYRPRQSLRVGIAIENAGHNGSALAALELATALKENGDILPNMMAFASGPIRSRAEHAGMRIDLLPSLPERASAKTIDAHSRRLANDFQRRLFDVIWVHGMAAFPAVAAAHFARIPVLWSLRQPCDWYEWFRGRFPAYLPRVHDLVAAVYQLVAPSYEMFHFDLEKLALLSVVPSVCPREALADFATVSREDARKRLALPATSRIVTLVGPVDETRRPQTVLAAAARVIESSNLDVRFRLVGCDSGSLLESMRESARRFGQRIEFVPPVDDVWPHLRASDVFVQSAAKASCSRGVQEAFALGVPVITAPYCGFGSFLVHGVNAMRWETDDAADLAETILQTLDDAALRERLVDQGRRTLDALPTFAESSLQYRRLLHEAAMCAR